MNVQNMTSPRSGKGVPNQCFSRRDKEGNAEEDKQRRVQASEPYMSIKLPTLKCTRCDYKWHPRSNKPPAHCANKKCKSPYWNKPRKK